VIAASTDRRHTAVPSRTTHSSPPLRPRRHAHPGRGRQALLDDLLAIATDKAIPDTEIGALIRGEKIGWERLAAGLATAAPRLPRDHGHLAMLEGAYLYVRQFTPEVLQALDFTGGKNAQPLITALAVLRRLNATGARKVPKGAPTDLSRPAGAATWRRRPGPVTLSTTGTTGS
jgi:hypothetical protein